MSGSSSPVGGSTPSNVSLSPLGSNRSGDPISPARPSQFPVVDEIVVLSPAERSRPSAPGGPNCFEAFFIAIGEAFKCCWESFCAFLKGLFCPVAISSNVLQRLGELERGLQENPPALGMLRYYMNVVRWHLTVTQGGSAEQMRAAFDALTDEKKLFYTNLVALKLQQLQEAPIQGVEALRAFTASNTRGITALVMQDLEAEQANEASLARLTYDYIAHVVEEAS